jgi:hypothetical protein
MFDNVLQLGLVPIEVDKLVTNKLDYQIMENIKVVRVNEDTEDGNYVIELYEPTINEWFYITTEYSISVASQVAVNLSFATDMKSRVLSRRSNNVVLTEI